MRYILLLAVLSACGETKIGQELDLGFVVLSPSDLSNEELHQMEIQIVETTEFVVEVDPKIYNKGKIYKLYDRQEFAIHVRDKSWGCPTEERPNRKCKGQYWHPRKIIIRWEEGECISETSLAHEMIHLLNRWVEGRSDRDHTDGRFFADKNSAEVKSEKAARDQLCPE